MSPPGAFRRGGRSGNGHDVSLLCDPAWLANRYLRSVQLHKLDDTGIKQVVLATGCSLGTWHVPSLLLDVWAGRWGWLGVLVACSGPKIRSTRSWALAKPILRPQEDWVKLGETLKTTEDPTPPDVMVSISFMLSSLSAWRTPTGHTALLVGSRRFPPKQVLVTMKELPKGADLTQLARAA